MTQLEPELGDSCCIPASSIRAHFHRFTTFAKYSHAVHQPGLTVIEVPGKGAGLPNPDGPIITNRS